MQFVSLFVFPRSCAIKRNLITNSFAGSTSPVTIQPGSADSFQRFSGISAARRLINEGQEIRLLYWAWPKSSQDRAVCLAKDGEGITDQAIAAVLVIEDLVKQGLTDKKMNDLYNLGIAHHTVAHMFRKKLTNQEIVALLNKALKDNATANKLMNPDTLTSEELRNLLKPAANSASVDKKLAKPTQAKESIEVSSSPKASSSRVLKKSLEGRGFSEDNQ